VGLDEAKVRAYIQTVKKGEPQPPRPNTCRIWGYYRAVGPSERPEPEALSEGRDQQILRRGSSRCFTNPCASESTLTSRAGTGRTPT
jgi:hypothetical protein